MDLTAVMLLAVSLPLAALLTPRFSGRGSWWVATFGAAAVSGWAFLLIDQVQSLPSFAMLAGVWGAAAAVDLAEQRLPDALTLIPFPLFFILQIPWTVIEGGWGRLGSALLGAAFTATILFVLAYINPSGFGLGDVKLGLTTGAALGWFGVGTALLGVAAAFILMAVISGLLLATGRIKREAEIAFGPFMILGVLVAPWTASLLGW